MSGASGARASTAFPSRTQFVRRTWVLDSPHVESCLWHFLVPVSHLDLLSHCLPKEADTCKGGLLVGKYFEKQSSSFHDAAHMQEVRAGNPWALMLTRKQKRQLVKQRNLARSVEIQAGRWFGGTLTVSLTRRTRSLGQQITSSCQKPWEPPVPPSSGNSREKEKRRARECVWLEGVRS